MGTEIHVVTSDNRHLYDAQMEAYHRLRYSIYIETLRWNGLVDRRDGLEIDQFDLATTAHFLAVQSGRVVGGARLNRTLGPHLLADVFPYLAAAKGVPRGPDVLEWTRVFVADDVRARDERPKVADIIIASLWEHALANGVTAITTVMAAYWLPRFGRYGWHVEPLCLPTEHEGEVLIGGRMEVSKRALASMRESCGIERSYLAFRGSHAPAAGEVENVA